MCSRIVKSFFGLNYRISHDLKFQGYPRHHLKYSTAASNQSNKNEEKVHTDAGIEETEVINGANGEITVKIKELTEENAKLLENVKELNDKYKRALADNENIRARMRREVVDAKTYGIQNFVKELVDVADVLSCATESIPKEALNSANSHLKSLFEGLQMTEAQLQTVFKRHGITKINPLGEKFNPNHHEALFEMKDPSKDSGTVGTVTKIGYKLSERIVRPAMVGVIKNT